MSRQWAYAWLGWLAVAAGLAVLGAWAFKTWEVSQPVPFPHKAHADIGVACDACHSGARDSARAGIPDAFTCGLCHQPGRPAPRTPKVLADHLAGNGRIPWGRVYEAPRHVRFSHQRHVGAGGLECKACHGDVARLDRPLGRQLVPLSMEACMACHRRERVATDCSACHR